MPSIHGGVSEEAKDEIMKRFDSQSEAVEFCIGYTLFNKYGVKIDE